MAAYVDTLDHSSIARQPVPGAPQQGQGAELAVLACGHSHLNALQVLVQIGYVGAALSLNVGAALLLAEVIPPVLVVATFAFTGVLTRLPARDLFAIPGNVFGGEARRVVPQSPSEFSTQPLVLLAARHYAPSLSSSTSTLR